MSDKEANFSGPLGDGSWEIYLDSGSVEVMASMAEDFATIPTAQAQHLRDFARNLELAADYLEGK